MAKFCAKGHQMEDSWEICPTCQTTGYQIPSVPQAKTRLESEPARESAGGARRTVLLSEKHKPPIVGWFVAMNGEQKGEDFRVRDGKNVVGSASDAQILLRDSTVSAQHASIRYEDGKFLLTDLDSSNGTYLNDRKIAREQIRDNDVVRFGDITTKFKCL